MNHGKTWKCIIFASSLISKKGAKNDHVGSKSWQPAEERLLWFAASVTRPFMLDGLHDQKYRIERLESCMLGNGHVQFGGGPMEKGNFCTSPAAYPTQSLVNFAPVCSRANKVNGC